MKKCPIYKKAIYLNCQECETKNCEDTRFYLLIVGSRTYNNYEEFITHTMRIIVDKISKGIVVVSGGAKGADSMAKRFAKENNFEYIEFPVDFYKSGKFDKSEAYKRNEQMHFYISCFKDRGCIAFWDGKSKGTKHSFKLAKDFNNPIRIVYINKDK